jgi:carboxypeptidase C (cathepsin A)
MAGSLADFKYIDNSGKAWLVRIDKSNALTTGTGFTNLTSQDLALDYLPRNIELRYVNCKHPTRPINRRIYCQSINAAAWKGQIETLALTDYQDRTIQNFKIGDRKQERASYTAKLVDTYQNDTPT